MRAQRVKSKSTNQGPDYDGEIVASETTFMSNFMSMRLATASTVHHGRITLPYGSCPRSDGVLYASENNPKILLKHPG